MSRSRTPRKKASGAGKGAAKGGRLQTVGLFATILVVAALIGWFCDHPDAYRLLILEPWGSGDPTVVGQAIAVRARLASELNALLAAAGAPLSVTLAAGAATMGAVLHLCELGLAGQVTRDEAIDVARRFVDGGLAGLGLR